MPVDVRCECGGRDCRHRLPLDRVARARLAAQWPGERVLAVAPEHFDHERHEPLGAADGVILVRRATDIRRPE